MEYWNELVHLFYLGIALLLLLYGFKIIFKAGLGVMPWIPDGMKQALAA